MDWKLLELGVFDFLFIGMLIGIFGVVSYGLLLGICWFVLFGFVSSVGDCEFLYGIGDYWGGVLLNWISWNILVGEWLMVDFMNWVYYLFCMKFIVGV